jgi:hypothetical protein
MPVLPATQIKLDRNERTRILNSGFSGVVIQLSSTHPTFRNALQSNLLPLTSHALSLSFG